MMNWLRRYFFTGLLVSLPLFISVYVLILIFGFVDGILGNFINIYFKKTLGFYIPGLGIILFFLIVILVGLLSSRFSEKLLQRYLDRIISRFPLLRLIYPPLKQIVTFLFSKDNVGFKKAVLIGFPYRDNWTLGFITNETFEEAKNKTGAELLNIFVPLAPNPTTGFIFFVPKEKVIFLDISIKEAIKLVISGGLLNPQDSSKDKLS
jgi:uncharacterized membrane protein